MRVRARARAKVRVREDQGEHAAHTAHIHRPHRPDTARTAAHTATHTAAQYVCTLVKVGDSETRVLCVAPPVDIPPPTVDMPTDDMPACDMPLPPLISTLRVKLYGSIKHAEARSSTQKHVGARNEVRRSTPQSKATASPRKSQECREGGRRWRKESEREGGREGE